jgi:hypothetical protein
MPSPIGANSLELQRRASCELLRVVGLGLAEPTALKIEVRPEGLRNNRSYSRSSRCAPPSSRESVPPACDPHAHQIWMALPWVSKTGWSGWCCIWLCAAAHGAFLGFRNFLFPAMQILDHAPMKVSPPVYLQTSTSPAPTRHPTSLFRTSELDRIITNLHSH